MGDAAIAALKSALYGMHQGGYITDYDLRSARNWAGC